jgi:hypothetical protein
VQDLIECCVADGGYPKGGQSVPACCDGCRVVAGLPEADRPALQSYLLLPTRPPCMHTHRGCVRAGPGERACALYESFWPWTAFQEPTLVQTKLAKRNQRSSESQLSCMCEIYCAHRSLTPPENGAGAFSGRNSTNISRKTGFPSGAALKIPPTAPDTWEAGAVYVQGYLAHKKPPTPRTSIGP